MTFNMKSYYFVSRASIYLTHKNSTFTAEAFNDSDQSEKLDKYICDIQNVSFMLSI